MRRSRVRVPVSAPKFLYHYFLLNAAIAQLVEHRLPKPRVAGSSPVCRSVLTIIGDLESLTEFCSIVEQMCSHFVEGIVGYVEI